MFNRLRQINGLRIRRHAHRLYRQRSVKAEQQKHETGEKG